MTKLETFLYYYSIYTDRSYIGNPELAGGLYKYIKSLGSMAPTQGDSTKWVFGIMNALGMTTPQQANQLIIMLLAKKDDIKAEFDEEFVEYGFLSIEDGGRGIEF